MVCDTWRAINQDYGCAGYYRQDYTRDTRASSRGEFKTYKYRTSPFVTAGVKMLNSDILKEVGYDCDLKSLKKHVRDNYCLFPF